MQCRGVVRLLAEEKYSVWMGSGSDIHIEPEPAPPEGAGANYQLETKSCSPTRSSCPTGPNQKSALEAQWQRQRAAGGLVSCLGSCSGSLYTLYPGPVLCLVLPLVRLFLPYLSLPPSCELLLGPGWALLLVFLHQVPETPTLALPGGQPRPRPPHTSCPAHTLFSRPPDDMPLALRLPSDA